MKYETMQHTQKVLTELTYITNAIIHSYHPSLAKEQVQNVLSELNEHIDKAKQHLNVALYSSCSEHSLEYATEKEKFLTEEVKRLKIWGKSKDSCIDQLEEEKQILQDKLDKLKTAIEN